MTTYRVHLERQVTSVVEIEADSVDEAMDAALDHPDAPGDLTISAFTGHAEVDTGSEWEPYEIADVATNETVWSSTPSRPAGPVKLERAALIAESELDSLVAEFSDFAPAQGWPGVIEKRLRDWFAPRFGAR